jgi:hypothetical protein
MTPRRVLFVALLAAAIPADALAVKLAPLLTGLRNPVFLTHAGDGSGRLYVIEQPGVIRVLGPGAAAATVFLDIEARVLDGGERGLLGLAFHPGYAGNGRFFVNYTRDPDGATVIAEYRRSANPLVATTAETVLLVVAQPFANHNGGMIAFGPDDLLYIGMGDGGGSNDPGNRAQNTSELLGKILRIDVDGGLPYAIPPDNPFAGGTAGRDEIYAVGVRNPFRFSFDRGTGQLFVADVGQGSREEIDVVSRGDNLGWRVFEGTRCTGLDARCDEAGFTPPIAEYVHTAGRCSITGGYAYRGSRRTLPDGAYVFGDFCSGEVFMLVGGVQRLLLDTTLGISSFGEDEAGELYVVGLGGSVHRLVRDRAGQRFDALPGMLPDFDGAGTADVLWKHAREGTFAIWFMTGGVAGRSPTFGVDGQWQLAGTGDLNGDGSSDLVWRSSVSGALGVWLMDGSSVQSIGLLGVGPGWDLVGAADLNGDGRDDLLWRSVTTADLGIWHMNGAMVLSRAVIAVPAAWTLAAAGDLDGDGTDDLVWHNATSLQAALWLFKGGAIANTAAIGVGPGWTIAGVADINADGRGDVVWRQPASGLTALWMMNAVAVLQTAVFGVDPAWEISALGDVNGDGAADILWRQPVTGVLGFWLMKGAAIADTITFSVGSGWTPAGGS